MSDIPPEVNYEDVGFEGIEQNPNILIQNHANEIVDRIIGAYSEGNRIRFNFGEVGSAEVYYGEFENGDPKFLSDPRNININKYVEQGYGNPLRFFESFDRLVKEANAKFLGQ